MKKKMHKISICEVELKKIKEKMLFIAISV